MVYVGGVVPILSNLFWLSLRSKFLGLFRIQARFTAGRHFQSFNARSNFFQLNPLSKCAAVGSGVSMNPVPADSTTERIRSSGENGRRKRELTIVEYSTPPQ